MRWTCYQQNTAMLEDSNTGHGHQTWLRHHPVHSWMHHYLPLFSESAYSKSFLASLALLFRITSRCITVHKQRKQGHKLLPRWDLRQEKSQRAGFEWLTGSLLSQEHITFFCCRSALTLTSWSPAKGVPMHQMRVHFWSLEMIPTFLILTFPAGGSRTNPSVALAYCILFEIPHRGTCRHRHPINRILISM